MTMRWFGASWNAPVNDDCPQAPPPVGELCSWCGEGIVAKDSGVIFANGPVAHRNCFFRQAFGSLAHLLHHCSCYVPGSTCGDDPKLTTRQAADEVARFLGFSDEPPICDFCAAREPLVLDVTAKAQAVGTFKSGNQLFDNGEWGACGECAALIGAKDFRGLLERAIAGTCAMFPDLAFDLKQRQRMTELIRGVFGESAL